MNTINQRAHLSGINKQSLAAPVPEPVVLLVPGDKPETGRDLGGVEELAGECNHAVHEVGLDDLPPDLALAGLVA